MQYEPGLYAQIQTAATKTWKRLPAKGDVSSSLTDIKQRPDDPFSDFVHCLLRAAGRILGNTDSGTDFVKLLAFENANSACQVAIQPYHKKKTDLSGYICLCAEISMAYQQGLAKVAAMQGTTVKQILANQSKNKCFNCGGFGHFAKASPQKQKDMPQKASSPGLCPRCKRGRHWVNDC